MKIGHSIEAGNARVHVGGEVDSAGCDCLEAFWRCHIPDDVSVVEIDLAEVEGMDGPSVAILTGIVRRHLDRGVRVTLRQPPQMLAHALYKVGLLSRPELALIDPRTDEQPYV